MEENQSLSAILNEIKEKHNELIRLIDNLSQYHFVKSNERMHDVTGVLQNINISFKETYEMFLKLPEVRELY